jgi:hypothetical protein
MASIYLRGGIGRRTFVGRGDWQHDEGATVAGELMRGGGTTDGRVKIACHRNEITGKHIV